MNALISIDSAALTVTVHGDDYTDLAGLPGLAAAPGPWARGSVAECQDLAEGIAAILDAARLSWSVEWP